MQTNRERGFCPPLALAGLLAGALVLAGGCGEPSEGPSSASGSAGKTVANATAAAGPTASGSGKTANAEETAGQSGQAGSSTQSSASNRPTDERTPAHESSDHHEAEAGAETRHGSGSTDNRPPPPPLLQGWPKPAVALVLTGEQHGYFEPCGCAAHQLGGLSRRADLFRILREERKWTVTALDVGGMVKRRGQQAQVKFQTLLAAHRELGYVAMALGPEELRFDPLYLLSQHQVDPEHPERSLSFVSANVVLLGDPDLGTPVPFKVVEVGGVKIGITGVLGPSQTAQLNLDATGAQVEVRDPLKVLPNVLEQLQKHKPDLLVLLSHASVAESRRYAKQFPQFDVVLTAGGPEDPLSNNPQLVGKTLLVMVGQKAKYVGVLGFYPDNPSERLRFELVAIDDQRFHDTPRMREYMRLYQDQLRDMRLAETVAQRLAAEPPNGAKYVGAEKCGECHTLAYDVWVETPHAHAFESLVHGREHEKDPIPRIYDPECLVCHVVGWDPQRVIPFRSGYVSQKKTPHLLNVQCENCHGPGSRHVERAEADAEDLLRDDVRVTVEQARKNLCIRCHDLDNSPTFEFDEYWPEVEHKGTD